MMTIITYMEVYGYDFESLIEKKLTDELFENLIIIDVNNEVAQYVLDYRKNPRKKIKLPDAIILATARHLSATLLTDDWDDFLGIDNNVVVGNIDSLKISL